MTAKWLVAKYMPDLRRREPFNVGVILLLDGQAYGRFRASRGEAIDGRSARWARSLDNYRAHVDYWKHLVAQGIDDEELTRLVTRVGDENYLLEFGGERLSAADEAVDPEVMLDRLYSALVEELPDRATLSVSELAENVMRQLPLPDGSLHRQFRLELPLAAGVADAVTFDYRFDNGAVHLMQKIPLSFGDERSWDAVHATLWGIERAREHPVVADRDQRFVGLVKSRDEDADLVQQLQVLAQHADVVDVTDVERAAGELRRLLHV